MVLADFQDYLQKQQEVNEVFQNNKRMDPTDQSSISWYGKFPATGHLGVCPGDLAVKPTPINL